MRKACEGSLRRLETDYIDVYLFHDNGFPAEQAQPVRDTLEALVKEGKIRVYGWSTDLPKNAEFFAQGEHCAAIEAQLNVLDDNPAIVNVCEQHNLALVNRGPLAMGLLTGKYSAKTWVSIDDVRGQKSPEWMKYFKDGQPSSEFLKKIEAVRQILTSNGRTLAQGALAWLWGRSENNIPIPGFRTVKQVEENAKAMQFGPLTHSQVEEIDVLIR
ncbi:MAG: aldo/keto reductase [Anaerolineae bacterium]|nr:aldo/keto reductase [Anaerolineae bacterium]